MFVDLNHFANVIGAPVDFLKAAIGLLACVFFSPLYRIFTSKISKNALSIIIGFGIIYFIIQQWAFFILGSIIIPYFLFKITKKPFILSVLISCILLLIVHSYRFIAIYSVWKVDCSVYVMLLVTKLTYYGKWIEKKQNQQTSSFFDFLGYNLYFPAVIAGPTYSYESYLAFINNKINTSLKTINWFKALQPFFIAVILSIIQVPTVSYFHQKWVIQNQFYLSLNFVFKLLLLNIVGFFYRLKYYVAWYYAQGAVNLSGLSQTQKGQYDGVVAVSLKFEFEPNVRNKTQYWNSSNQQWLKNVVFQSINERFGQNVAFFGTFMTSAFWHGIYLNYYVGFLFWGILIHINKWAYKMSLSYPKLSDSRILNILAPLVSLTIFNTLGMFMAILNWDYAIKFYSDLYFSSIILLIVGFVITYIVKPKKPIKKQ